MIRPALTALAALAAAVPALAAEPESGEVSASNPKVEWKGNAGGYPYATAADLNGGFPSCDDPMCDEFALTVKDQADLTVTITDDDGSGFMTMEVEDPDGTKHYNGGDADQPTTVIRLKKAKPGAYVVRAATNNTPTRGDAYSARAALGSGPAKGPAAPGSTPPPSQPAPAQPPAGQPAPAPAPTITVVRGKLSARKAKKRLTIGLSSDGRVSGLVATLEKGSKRVGSGRLATLDGPGKIVLKVKRLRKGRYTFRVAGRSDAGNVVATQLRLRIRR